MRTSSACPLCVRPRMCAPSNSSFKDQCGLTTGVVLKIETAGLREPTELLMATMRTPLDGVMIARGDLAVELGFERIAEVQEEILWFCEAAHLPVIWATQVLESLAKAGAPSRAEVTDAAMSGRAECVMLNKGPYIVDAVRFLNRVLERMAEHRAKRRTMMRRLAVSQLPQPLEAPRLASHIPGT